MRPFVARRDPCTGVSDMAKRKYCFDEAKIKKLRSQGRGSGSGRKYNPWIHAHDFGSVGLTSRVLGWKSGRIHHFLSRLEVRYFYLLEWSDRVIDIREQFPLEHHAALHFANEAGINYPWERKTGYNTVMTTDFLVTVVDSAGVKKDLARTLKHASDLRDKQGKATLEKFEIERRFWQAQGVDWGIVTDLQLPEPLVSNIEDCHGYRELGCVTNLGAEEVSAVENLIGLHLQDHPDRKLSAFAATLEQSLSLKPGTGLAVIKHLLANKRLAIPTQVRWFKNARCKDVICNRGQISEAV